MDKLAQSMEDDNVTNCEGFNPVKSRSRKTHNFVYISHIHVLLETTQNEVLFDNFHNKKRQDMDVRYEMEEYYTKYALMHYFSNILELLNK